MTEPQIKEPGGDNRGVFGNGKDSVRDHNEAWLRVSHLFVSHVAIFIIGVQEVYIKGRGSNSEKERGVKGSTKGEVEHAETGN